MHPPDPDAQARRPGTHARRRSTQHGQVKHLGERGIQPLHLWLDPSHGGINLGFPQND
jgi:hypothetical protein